MKRGRRTAEGGEGSSVQVHIDGIFGTQGDGGLELHALIGNEVEFPALGERGEQENAFGPGEGFTDAEAGSAAEGEVGEFWARGLGLGRPAVEVEADRDRDRNGDRDGRYTGSR